MPQFDRKIQQLFQESLLNNEDIHWLGEPAHAKWYPRWADIAFWLASLMIFSPVLMAVFLLLYILQQIITSDNPLSVESIILYIFLYVVFASTSFIGRLWRSQTKSYHTISGYLNYQPYRWWQTTFYAITSQRVLISDQGRIRDYWYHLLDEPILSKSKKGTADILLYSSTFASEKKKYQPLDRLRDIPLDEAEEALNIIKQAWEEALLKKNRLPVEAFQNEKHKAMYS